MKATATALIKRGLIISLPKLKGPSRLLVTDAGRAAIGREPQAQPLVSCKPAMRPIEAPKAPGKIDLIVDLMGDPQGATIEAMMAATGWQAHSVRGAIAGTVKKGRGLEVTSAKVEGVRVYRIGTQPKVLPQA